MSGLVPLHFGATDSRDFEASQNVPIGWGVVQCLRFIKARSLFSPFRIFKQKQSENLVPLASILSFSGADISTKLLGSCRVSRQQNSGNLTLWARITVTLSKNCSEFV